MFSLSDATQAGFSSSQILFNSSLMQDSFYLSQQVVQIGDVATLQTNGVLQFSLPGFSTQSFTAVANRVDYQNPDNYVWAGDLTGNAVGQILLVATEGQVNGFVQTTGRYFTLMAMSSGYGLLLENNRAKSELVKCASLPVETPPESTFDGCTTAMNLCPANIRILYLVTPEASGFFNRSMLNPPFSGVKPGWVQTATESINQAFENSGIPNKSVTGISVDFPFEFHPLANIDADMVTLLGSQAAMDLRDLHRADVVILLTNRESVPPAHAYFTTGGTEVRGRVADIGPDIENAYAIVEVQFMLDPTFSLAHEFAHLLGALHNRTDNGGNDDTDVCSHGFQFTDVDENVQRTIMALFFDGGEGNRILNFSNPAIAFNGAATGTAAADNARTIRNTACFVSGFRGPENWHVTPYIEPEVCLEDIDFQACAIVTPGVPGMPGQAPFTWYWATNFSGIFPPSPPVGTLAGDECTTIAIPGGSPFFFVHVWVSTADGEFEQITKKVKIHPIGDEWCTQFRSSDGKQRDNQMLTVSDWSVFPNPTDGIFRLSMPGNLQSGGEVIVINTLGQPLRSLSFPENSSFLDIDLQDRPTGLYLLCIKHGGNLIGRSIIKQ